VIRADTGQARTCWYMRRDALGAHGQCLFVQLQFLFNTKVRHLLHWCGRPIMLGERQGKVPALAHDPLMVRSETRRKR
jgi:hypothetical protein